MITAEQALSYQFQKVGMNGYRMAEVDEFVSAAAETLNFQEKKVRDMQRIIDELKKNETIIQTTLVNAQKLAMQLTDEAQQNADTLTAEAEQKATDTISQAEARAEATVTAAEERAAELTAAAEANYNQSVADTEQKAQQILDDVRNRAAAEEAQLQAELERQRKILDALKAEVSAFRSDILNRYKAQVTLIKDLPDMMPEAVVDVVVEQPAPVAEPMAEEPVAGSVEPAEQESAEDVPVMQVTFTDAQPDEDTVPAGSDLLKLMNDMAENEAQAAAAVDEVASLTGETAEEESASAVRGGFRILIDDDDDEEDGQLSFGGRIQVDDSNE